MACIPKTPNQSLSPAWLKVKPGREQFEQFKEKLSALVGQINRSPDESEEHHKNHISDFLKFAFPAYFINTNDRIDLVIHNGKSPADPVGVIIEAKRPSGQAEMPSQDNLNVKAMQELVLYYLRERIAANNLAVKHLVITNGYEWFIFDAHVFEKAFASNKALAKQFKEFSAGLLSGNTTDFFYREIAKPAIEKMGDVEFTYFDLREKHSDKKLIALLKVFSPEHLLKLPFANDSNSLNKGFYSELLHLIGLVEVKDGSKKLIQRKQEGERNRGSLLENAIAKLDAQDRLRHFEKPGLFGETKQEQLFNVGLELVITWVNRILFLKLLEAQLITYHKGDSSYAFLNSQRIKSFDELDALFFEVLARKPDEREESVKQAFAKVPYLNSSLFEPTEIESKSLFIGNLVGEITLPLFCSTMLKDAKGKRRAGELNTLEYLFAFLDAYDFASEGKGELKDDNKALISASVLGLIFEKINGYKDGSFFTPGFITMYMCRETLRRAVVQKFNEAKGWGCNNITDLYNKIEAKAEDRAEANTLINSLKICDPAVGSGHFLVSVLNELIAIKSELGILQDAEGKRLKNYSIEIVNDELLVSDDDGDEFTYNPANPESARIQKTLFNEKQTLIENCLFGVDINPNSVKICRLRLWIELLKNAYYNADGQLETLPNIDINIKVGNSLISRFALDADLKDALKKSKLTLADYRKAVDTYRNASSKEQKREMERIIAEIKTNFRSEIIAQDPKAKKLENMRAELKLLELPQTLLEESAKEKKERKQKQEKLKLLFDKLNAEIEEIKNNKIYENAFEWRFEFPEILNDEGAFVGFDVVIGNPPYISAIELKKRIGASEYAFYKMKYETAKGTVDLYIYFFELSFRILSAAGMFGFITPNRFLSASYGEALRNHLISNSIFVSVCDFSSVKVFAEAQTYPVVTILKNEKPKTSYPFSSYRYTESTGNYRATSFDSEQLTFLSENILGFILSDKFEITKKVVELSVSLNMAGKINATSTTAEADAFHDIIEDGYDGFKLINTGTIDRFATTWGKETLTDQGKKYKFPYLPKAIKLLGENRFSLYSSPKIVFAKIALKTEAFYDEHGEYASINTNCIHSFSPIFNPLYILAWVNSKLFQYIYECFFDGLRMSGGYLTYSAPTLSNMYINNAGVEAQENIAALSGQVLHAKAINAQADTDSLENKIDNLFYALYGLTSEEIALVEGSAGKVLAVPDADTAEVFE